MNLTHNQRALIHWIIERDKIRKLKESGAPKPWSMEPVFQKTYFCNVNREDDKVTRWIRENWHYEIDPTAYTFAMIVARIFNLPDTLKEIGQPKGYLFHWLDDIHVKLEARKALGKSLWNGAYIISTNGKKIDKLSHCLDLFFNIILEHPDPVAGCETLEEAHKALMKVDGLASFLAAQVVADLKNTRGHALQDAPDWWTFCSDGPGSLRGLGWFFEEKVTKKNFQERIQETYFLIEGELPSDIRDILCMQNLQNCLCEYDKYMRVLNGTGRSKRKYDGGAV